MKKLLSTIIRFWPGEEISEWFVRLAALSFIAFLAWKIASFFIFEVPQLSKPPLTPYWYVFAEKLWDVEDSMLIEMKADEVGTDGQSLNEFRKTLEETPQ